MAATATSIEQEIRDLEKQNWEAFKAMDTRKLRQLTASRMLMVMSEGIYDSSGDEFIKMMEGEPGFKLKSYRLDEAKTVCRELAPGVVTLAYPVHMEFEREGKPGKIDSFFTSTWIKEGGNWRQTFSTESILQPAK